MSCLVENDEVIETMSSWIIEEGSLNKVSIKLGLSYAAVHRVYNGVEPMTKTRWEKWKKRWQGTIVRKHQVVYYRTKTMVTEKRWFENLNELAEWFTRQNELETIIIIRIN